jgi:hypothetical protein
VASARIAMPLMAISVASIALAVSYVARVVRWISTAGILPTTSRCVFEFFFSVQHTVYSKI